jgi:hypothetical protein
MLLKCVRNCEIEYWLRHGRQSVRPSVLMEELGSHWKDFHEIWCLNIFRNYVEILSSLIEIGQAEHVLYIQL